MGSHARLHQVSGELLFSIRPRVDCRSGPRGAVFRRRVGAGRDGDRRRAVVGWAGPVLAVSGFFTVRVCEAARTGWGARADLQDRGGEIARRVSYDPQADGRVP